MAIIMVRRANVILDVPEGQKDEYLAKGFDVIDARGRVIEKTTPNDMNTLKKAYAELNEELTKLKKENEQLKAKLAVKPAKVEEPKKAEIEFKGEEEIPEPAEPRKRRKRQ